MICSYLIFPLYLYCNHSVSLFLVVFVFVFFGLFGEKKLIFFVLVVEVSVIQ